MRVAIAAIGQAHGVLYEYAPLRLANRTDIRGRPLVDEAADGAEIPVGILALESDKPIRLLREGQVLLVGHRLASKILLQVFHGPLVHDAPPDETHFER